MFACIFIPDFPVQALTRYEPELCCRPIAIFTGTSPAGESRGAERKRAASGRGIGATKSQLEAWESLILRARSESQETSAHAALLDCAQSFSRKWKTPRPA